MRDSDPGSITQAFTQLREGDQQAIHLLWQRFFPRLVGLAQKKLPSHLRRAADADDAAQSAFASFYQRAAAGDFGDLLRRDELWRLLAVMTARKALRQARRENAAKRGGGQVIGEGDLAGLEDEIFLEQLAATLPAHDFDLCCQELLERLDESLQSYALLRLLGYKNREIAEQFDCTERKVERKLHLIRLTWESLTAE